MAEDLSAEQTDKLVQFQEITHIESIDECKQLLEAFNWDLEVAVQNTFNDQPNLNSQPSTSQSSNDNNNNASNGNTNSTNSAHTSTASLFEQDNNNIEAFLNNFEALHNLNHTNNLNNLNGLANDRPNLNNTHVPNRTTNNQSLPNLNVYTQRTLVYPSTRQAVVPRGIIQWGVFIVAFPFKFLFSTLYELASFFWSFFESSAIPIDYDPLANIAEYAIQYNQKYGTNHPEFYQGSYSQAVNEAKRDLKFLLVYIHQNDNKDCNTFATETLTNIELIDFLRHTFLFWSCSKNLPEGQKVFNALKARRAPFLGVVVVKNSRMTLVSKIEGPITAAELMLQLASLIAEHENDLVIARQQREERTQNQLLREQQDQAYLESLRVDKEKERKKQEQAEAKKRELELEKQRIEEEEARVNAILKKKSDLREKIANTQQPDAKDPLALKLIIKLPTGNRYERVFLKTDPLSDLYKFVFSNEECPINFEIVTNFPRKVIECTEETSTSIQDFGISQSMILFVNDLDA